MALRNASGNYLRIARVDLDGTVAYELYASESVRRNGPGQFDRVVQDSVVCGRLPAELRELADATKTIRDNVFAAAYRALKREEVYQTWADC